MPYTPVGVDATYLPRWNEVHPDLHPRWIGMDARRRAGHAMSFGETPGYKEYGADMTIDKLEEAVEAIGLPKSYINYNLNRVVYGDLMLAFIPKAEFMRRVKERIALSGVKEQAIIDAFKEEVKRPGIKPIVYGSEEEYKDMRDFHTREGSPKVGYSGAASQ